MRTAIEIAATIAAVLYAAIAYLLLAAMFAVTLWACIDALAPVWA
jgi:hypothetical protein